MSRNDTENKSRVEVIQEYQMKRAKEYLEKNISQDGSESSLECCIISDLLRIIKGKLEWVSVEERLPEMADRHGLISDKLLIAQGVNDKQITFGWWNGKAWLTADMMPFARQELITHWMPVPSCL